MRLDGPSRLYYEDGREPRRFALVGSRVPYPVYIMLNYALYDRQEMLQILGSLVRRLKDRPAVAFATIGSIAVRRVGEQGVDRA